MFYKIQKCTRRYLNRGRQRIGPMNKRILTTSQRFQSIDGNAVSLFPHARSISIARYYVLRFNYSTKLWELHAIRSCNCHSYMIHGILYDFNGITYSVSRKYFNTYHRKIYARIVLNISKFY